MYERGTINFVHNSGFIVSTLPSAVLNALGWDSDRDNDCDNNILWAHLTRAVVCVRIFCCCYRCIKRRKKDEW